MTKQEQIKNSVERIHHFLSYLYKWKGEFNFSDAVDFFGALPYASPLRVVLRDMKLIEPTSMGWYKWVANLPTHERAQDVYDKCRKSYNKVQSYKTISQDDLYAIYLEEADIIEPNIKGLDKVKETAYKAAEGEETTFVLYKKIGTITVKPSIIINYD